MNTTDRSHGDHDGHGHSEPDHEAHQGHEGHGGHGPGGKHAGHHTEAFRRRFWWSLLLTVPVVATSHMVMDWFGYELASSGSVQCWGR